MHVFASFNLSNKIRFLSEWCQEREKTKKIGDMDDEELDVTLRQFYAEARNKNGEHYGRSTLLEGF